MVEMIAIIIIVAVIILWVIIQPKRNSPADRGQIGEDWVDVTDPELMSRLGLDKLPPELQEEVAMPGDPCITVLFK